MGAFLFTQNAPYFDYLEVLEAANRIDAEAGAFHPVSYDSSTPAPSSAEPWIVVEDE